MTREELDALFARSEKILPAHPDWREGTQVGTRRAYLPVTLAGASTGLTVAMTVRAADPGYLVINLLANRICVARLCLSGGHRDRATRTFVADAHFHRWQDNRPGGSKIGKSLKLRKHVDLPASASTRDTAFELFLKECGIESPAWGPMKWPINRVLF